MSLKEYKEKRNLKKSGEPTATIKNKKSDKKLYVIQEHHASHLHWDLRLSINGVLKSWAIPKEPPKTKGIKRLAISVEDHPISYAKFEGEIKEGYGKGTVKIWDKGTYDLIQKDKKKIEIEIHGEKLKGKYVLVKTHYGNKPEKSWLFMKI
ncbi:MAG: 3'-phosphoesterase [Candidatus Pacearchaeota archaeon]|nr:3'-phosphoesterase [Candidatus Pacearchaeota archaeon]